MFLKNRIDKVRNFDYSTSTVNVTKELSKNLIACEEYPYFVVLNQKSCNSSKTSSCLAGRNLGVKRNDLASCCSVHYNKFRFRCF